MRCGMGGGGRALPKGRGAAGWLGSWKPRQFYSGLGGEEGSGGTPTHSPPLSEAIRKWLLCRGAPCKLSDLQGGTVQEGPALGREGMSGYLA